MQIEPQNWIARFTGLAELELDAAKQLICESKLVDLPAKTTVFGPHKTPDTMLLVLSGSVRVQQNSEGGHEIVLYRIQGGESCVMTTACLLSHEAYSATGITETAVTAVVIPRRVFDELIGTSAVFRNFVFAAFSKRITELFLMVEEVAFQRIDVRLAHKLVTLAEDQMEITTTHQNLSIELGTAREVISRQLQEFQRRGWIALERGKVTLLNKSDLKRLASSVG